MAVKQAGPQLLLSPQHSEGGLEDASSSTNKSLSLHRWTNWIAGFSGDFARSAIQQYLPFPRPDSIVMDPFAGVGTTLVEAYRQGIDCIGFELNPFAALVSEVKLLAPSLALGPLREAIAEYRGYMETIENLVDDGADASTALPDLHASPPAGFKSRIPFFSPRVEKKVLYTLEFSQGLPAPVQDVFGVALASVMVEFSNYTYEPSLGSRPAAGKDLVENAPVGQIVGAKLQQMAQDMADFQVEMARQLRKPRCEFHPVSFFDAERLVRPASVDLVVTSPPYVNNYHYVRNTRPQLFWTLLVTSPKDLKRLEEGNFGKFWQTVRGLDPIPLQFSLTTLATEIAELRRSNGGKGVYGGGGWANYVVTYMNDLYRFCGLLGRLLRVGGTAVVVVGNSVIQGREIKVEDHLCDIAAQQRLSVVGVARLRDRVGSSIVNSGPRLSGGTKPALYDVAVILRRQR